MSTTISVIGTIATEPRLLTAQARATLCSFRLASKDRWFDREQGSWVDGDTNWYTVTAFRALAVHAHQSFQKGDRIIVSGRCRIKEWEHGDRAGTTAEIEAEGLGHDLRWGTSMFTRVRNAEASSTAVPSAPASNTGTSDTGAPPTLDTPGVAAETSTPAVTSARDHTDHTSLPVAA